MKASRDRYEVHLQQNGYNQADRKDEVDDTQGPNLKIWMKMKMIRT